MKDVSGKRFWSRFAFAYAPFMRKNKKLYADSYAVFKEYLTQDMSVLELACGTGQYTDFIAGCASAAEATDFSEKMLKRAKRKVKAANVRFSVQDATCLKYPDASFDAVFIANALHIMPDPKSAIFEIRRVLKQGGLLIAPTFVYDDSDKTSKVKIAEKVGFKTYNKWNSNNLVEFVADGGFNVIEAKNIESEFLNECVLIAKKQNEDEIA